MSGAVRIGVAFLCHDELQVAADMVRTWQEGGAAVAIHVDRRTAEADYQAMRDKLADLGDIVEDALRKAALWNEVKDRLGSPGTGLSGGQQQRLCIARAIATSPEVLLMDEPCSALDPIATAQIEELIDTLRQNYCVVIVTHSMHQAARISQKTAFFHLGNLVEYGDTDQIFTTPHDTRTESYITGRIG